MKKLLISFTIINFTILIQSCQSENTQNNKSIEYTLAKTNIVIGQFKNQTFIPNINLKGKKIKQWK
ncbi:hypothetical protein [Flavobacterium sp.]|uniref:hypothetical protein n=1 Tax=Flavobacterium sp. TaxID=239 RepID=UPI003D0BD47D